MAFIQAKAPRSRRPRASTPLPLFFFFSGNLAESILVQVFVFS